MSSIQADHGEYIVTVTDEHWIKYVPSLTVSFFLFFITILLFILAGMSAHHYMWLSHATYIAALILFLTTMHWFFMMMLSETLDRIIITNRRLLRLRYRMLFDEDVLKISFEKMKTVDAKKHGIIQNILHYGTLFFETKLAAVPYVPHPNRIAKIIQEAMHKKD